jgi:putative transposase
VWPRPDGVISYLLTVCVDGRRRVLNNELVFERFVGFLCDSPVRYRWFGRRFVLMPDHIHVIAYQADNALPLGHWIKAMKAVVGRLERSPDTRDMTSGSASAYHQHVRTPPSWRWQAGFFDHKFRSRQSETRKWEYVCLNPVRAGLVKRPEDWPFGGEIVYENVTCPTLIRGAPPLLDQGMLVVDQNPEDKPSPTGDSGPEDDSHPTL